MCLYALHRVPGCLTQGMIGIFFMKEVCGDHTESLHLCSWLPEPLQLCWHKGISHLKNTVSFNLLCGQLEVGRYTSNLKYLQHLPKYFAGEPWDSCRCMLCRDALQVMLLPAEVTSGRHPSAFSLPLKAIPEGSLIFSSTGSFSGV